MQIDLRGLMHPNHIKHFKEALEGSCTVHEEIEVLLDDETALKTFEMYIRSCLSSYSKDTSAGTVRITIKPPFSMCGI